MREPSTQALEAARALLLRELPAPAERSDLAHVAQRVMLQLGKVMVQWIGAAGFAALLRRSLHEAGIGHPLLQTLRLDAGQIVHAAAAPSPPDAAAEREALVAFLATFIGLLGRVAGDAMALSLTEQAFAGAQEASVKSLAASPSAPIADSNHDVHKGD